jgi:hypothetical protein
MIIKTNTFAAAGNSMPYKVVMTDGPTEASTVSSPPTRATTALPFILGGMRQDQNDIKAETQTGSNYSAIMLYIYMKNI